MRDSNLSAQRRRGGLGASTIVLGLVLAACGGTVVPSVQPTREPVVSPTVTPDPHLSDPTTLEAIYRGLQTAGLTMIANTAATGGSHEPRRRISLTYRDWPLIISEYSSAKALASVTKWKAGAKPKQGQAPITIKGLNILIEWGPTTGAKPLKPSATQQAAITALVAALDPMLYPLKARVNIAVMLPVHLPAPSPSPLTSPGPSRSTAPAP